MLSCVRITASLAFSTAALLSTGAVAQDAGPAGLAWSGAYAGLHGGLSNGDFSSYGYGGYEGTLLGFIPIDIFLDGSESASGKGEEGGIYAGYNFRLDNGAVLGVETDWSWTSQSGSIDGLVNWTERVCFFGCSDIEILDLGAVSTEVTQYGTLRGRIGQSFDRFLVYLTGGVAYAEVETEITASAIGLELARESDSSFRVGYAVGFGAEYAFNNWLSLKAELLMVDLGEETVWSYDNDGLALGITSDIGFTTARVGLAAHF